MRDPCRADKIPDREMLSLESDVILHFLVPPCFSGTGSLRRPMQEGEVALRALHSEGSGQGCGVGWDRGFDNGRINLKARGNDSQDAYKDVGLRDHTIALFLTF